MVLKLFIKKQSDPSFSKDINIDKFPALLGREEDSDIPLPDPLRIISRKHAQIIDTQGILQLIDLDSANYTYLNEQKLEPDEENPLKSGDKIRIGDYELELELLRGKQPSRGQYEDDDQKTIVFASPYKEEITAIADSLGRIAMKYSSDNSPMKSESLKFSLNQTFKGYEINEIGRIMAEYFSENFAGRNIPVFKNEIVEEPEMRVSPSSVKKTFFESSESQVKEYSFGIHFTNVIDTLLDMFSKLVQGFLLFRQEFFGVTIYYQMPADSMKELKEYLFNPSISSEEETKREVQLKEETQKLLSHQLGLLEGYKSSVTEGSKLLLQSLNPETIGEERSAGQKKRPGTGGLLSGFKRSRKLELIAEHYKKYLSDPYHLEKKFFRPSFIKGYQKRISDRSQNEF